MQILKNSTPHHFVRKRLVVFFEKWGGSLYEQGGRGVGGAMPPHPVTTEPLSYLQLALICS